MIRRHAPVIALCLFLAACVGPGNIVGHKVPNFTLKKVDGTTVTAADLRGKPYILYFFASW